MADDLNPENPENKDNQENQENQENPELTEVKSDDDSQKEGDSNDSPSGESPSDESPSDVSPGETADSDEISDEPNEEDADKVVNAEDASEDDAEAAMLAMLEDLPEEDSSASVDDINFGNTEVSQAEFQQLSKPVGSTETRNIEMLLDVNLPVSIELGKTNMSISDILSLGPGSVVELNKLAGEPVDVLVNNKAVAKGEVVVIDENFGVRVTQLLTPEERLKALAEA